jgi:ABC-type sulfate/molybdate transport systems ATPase subunit
LEEALSSVLAEPSFGVPSGNILSELMHPDPAAAFLRLSSGHKITLHVIASLVAYAEPKSIVLFDEPESHLHPPLLATLMHGIRVVLENRDSFAVVATHSPVVVQESLARHVHVVRREGDITHIYAPSIETFGENIGTITSEIFGLTASVTDYHTALRRVAMLYDTIEEAETALDGSLSMQARAFVMSLLAAKRRTK